jgi:hypothetical protein
MLMRKRRTHRRKTPSLRHFEYPGCRGRYGSMIVPGESAGRAGETIYWGKKGCSPEK